MPEVSGEQTSIVISLSLTVVEHRTVRESLLDTYSCMPADTYILEGMKRGPCTDINAMLASHTCLTHGSYFLAKALDSLRESGR